MFVESGEYSVDLLRRFVEPVEMGQVASPGKAFPGAEHDGRVCLRVLLERFERDYQMFGEESVDCVVSVWSVQAHHENVLIENVSFHKIV